VSQQLRFPNIRAVCAWAPVSCVVVLALAACSPAAERGTPSTGTHRASSSAAPSGPTASPPPSRGRTTAASAPNSQDVGGVEALCSKLDLNSVAAAVPGTGHWVSATKTEIIVANLDLLYKGPHQADCMLFPAKQRPLTNGFPNNFVVFSEAVTPQDFQFFAREVSLYGVFPAIAIGDQGLTDANSSGYVAFRVGQRWFNLEVRVPGPDDPDHTNDQNRENQLAFQLGSQLAAAVSQP
jgi:hypothetical protein